MGVRPAALPPDKIIRSKYRHRFRSTNRVPEFPSRALNNSCHRPLNQQPRPRHQPCCGGEPCRSAMVGFLEDLPDILAKVSSFSTKPLARLPTEAAAGLCSRSSISAIGSLETGSRSIALFIFLSRFVSWIRLIHWLFFLHRDIIYVHETRASSLRPSLILRVTDATNQMAPFRIA